MNVSKEEFWQFVMTTGRNIHPRPEREFTEWVDQRTHQVVAITKPGYMRTGEESYDLRAS